MSSSQHISDEQLVTRCRQGNRKAFETLVHRYITRLYDYCYRMLGSKVEAEDAVQETFTAAFQGLANFEGAASFATWIYRISHNKAVDTLRRREARNHRVIFSDELDFDVPDHSDPLAPLVRQAEAEHLWACVARLPPKYRTVILLFYRENLTYEEIAQVLESPKRTVETRLYRARRALRQMWTKTLELEVDTGGLP